MAIIDITPGFSPVYLWSTAFPAVARSVVLAVTAGGTVAFVLGMRRRARSRS